MADTSSGSTTDAVTLTQLHVLAVADTATRSTTDSVVIDDGIVDTFLETFEDSSALSRFSVHNFRTQWDNEQGGADGQDSNQGFGLDIPDNTHVASGELVIETSMQNYGETAARSNTPVLVVDGTTIEWDATIDTHSTPSPETQMVALLLDRPYVFTSFEGENANGPHPQHGVGFYAKSPLARQWDNYAQTTFFQFGGPGETIPSGVVDREVSQHWVMTIDDVAGTLYVNVTIDGNDDDVAPVPVPAAMVGEYGWFALGAHNHASNKYTPFVDTVECRFDNLEYNNAGPAARAAEVAVSGPEQFGWQLTGSQGAAISHSTSALALGTATEAWLVVNTGGFASGDADAGTDLLYALNGNTSHVVPFEVVIAPGVQSFSIPVDVDELVHGINLVEVWATGVVNHQADMRYANVQLIAVGGSADPPAVDLVVADTATGSTTDAVSLTQAHALAVADTSTGATTDVAGALVQQHNLSVADTSSGATTDAATLTQAHALTVADTSTAATTDTVVLTQTHTLAGVADTSSGSTTDATTLTQAHALAVADTSTGSSTDAVALTQAHTLAGVADTSTGVTTDAVSLSGAGTLGVDDTSTGATTDGIALTQTHTLAGVADTSTGATTDPVTLTQLGDLTVADTSSGSTTDTVALTQAHQLAGVADTTTGATTDALTLVTAGALVVADTSTGSTTDAVALTQAHNLQVADTVAGATTDAVTLTQEHVLVVADTSTRSTTDIVVWPAEVILGSMTGEWVRWRTEGEWVSV